VVYRIEDKVIDGALTQRGADRVTRLAWTLADLSGAGRPGLAHVEEALSLRTDASAGKQERGRLSDEVA
jgi:magnesium chelatase family protein